MVEVIPQVPGAPLYAVGVAASDFVRDADCGCEGGAV